MDKFYIITNRDKDQNLRFTEEIVQYLKEHGKKCQVQQAERKTEGTYHYTDPELIPEGTQCILVLGGDGTLLQAARDVVHREIPMLGVNLGTLGFLAEIDKPSIYAALDKLFADDYEIEERMMLTGTVWRGDKIIGQDVALNDIVVSRSGFSRVIGLKVYVNEKVMDIYEADGLIVSTPTGSTGYNLSAGGPIVSPKTSLMIVTPVSPHSLTSKSIVFSSEDEIAIEVLKMRKAQEEEAIVSFDGQPGTQLSTGDRIVIKKSGAVTNMVKLFDVSFYEVLREKITNHF